MISSDVLRGYNDTMILFLILQEPSYGYEIAKKIRENSGGKYIMKETTLYSVFTRLEKNGYVTSFFGNETSGSGGPITGSQRKAGNTIRRNVRSGR